MADQMDTRVPLDTLRRWRSRLSDAVPDELLVAMHELARDDAAWQQAQSDPHAALQDRGITVPEGVSVALRSIPAQWVDGDGDTSGLPDWAAKFGFRLECSCLKSSEICVVQRVEWAETFGFNRPIIVEYPGSCHDICVDWACFLVRPHVHVEGPISLGTLTPMPEEPPV